ncbi:hypothetical protein BJX64DRAFT_114921 [Aspergillus heterothallicus]
MTGPNTSGAVNPNARTPLSAADQDTGSITLPSIRPPTPPGSVTLPGVREVAGSDALSSLSSSAPERLPSVDHILSEVPNAYIRRPSVQAGSLPNTSTLGQLPIFDQMVSGTLHSYTSCSRYQAPAPRPTLARPVAPHVSGEVSPYPDRPLLPPAPPVPEPEESTLPPSSSMAAGMTAGSNQQQSTAQNPTQNTLFPSWPLGWANLVLFESHDRKIHCPLATCDDWIYRGSIDLHFRSVHLNDVLNKLLCPVLGCIEVLDSETMGSHLEAHLEKRRSRHH